MRDLQEPKKKQNPNVSVEKIVHEVAEFFVYGNIYKFLSANLGNLREMIEDYL